MKYKGKVLIFQGNGKPMKSQKIGRNRHCQCGSGKKAKYCCGVETKYFIKQEKRNYQKS